MKASIAEAPALVAAQSAELRDTAAARKRLEGELAVHQARALYEMTAPTPGGVRVAVLRRDGGSLEEIRPIAQAFAALPRTVFVAAVLSPATVLVAAADDADVDAGRLLKRGARSRRRQRRRVADDWRRAPSLTRTRSRAS